MKKFITPKVQPERPAYGSAYDPVLTGVAQGLARLFPPLEPRPQPGREEGEGRRTERRA